MSIVPVSWLVFDIESQPIPEVESLMPEFEANRTLKDPEKIKADLARKRQDWLDDAALDPSRCEVTCLSWRAGWILSTDATPALARDTLEERAIVECFWALYREAERVIGYNILGFDLPVLLMRARFLNVCAPVGVIDGPYRHDPKIIDLQDEWSFGRKELVKSKDWVCKRLGIEVADATTGAEMPAAAARGDWPTVIGHCQADVEKEVAIARWLGVL